MIEVPCHALIWQVMGREGQYYGSPEIESVRRVRMGVGRSTCGICCGWKRSDMHDFDELD